MALQKFVHRLELMIGRNRMTRSNQSVEKAGDADIVFEQP